MFQFVLFSEPPSGIAALFPLSTALPSLFCRRLTLLLLSHDYLVPEPRIGIAILGAPSTLLASPASWTCLFPHMLFPEPLTGTAALFPVAFSRASLVTVLADIPPVYASLDPRSFLAHAGPRDDATMLSSAARA